MAIGAGLNDNNYRVVCREIRFNVPASALPFSPQSVTSGLDSLSLLDQLPSGGKGYDTCTVVPSYAGDDYDDEASTHYAASSSSSRRRHRSHRYSDDKSVVRGTDRGGTARSSHAGPPPSFLQSSASSRYQASRATPPRPPHAPTRRLSRGHELAPYGGVSDAVHSWDDGRSSSVSPSDSISQVGPGRQSRGRRQQRRLSAKDAPHDGYFVRRNASVAAASEQSRGRPRHRPGSVMAPSRVPQDRWLEPAPPPASGFGAAASGHRTRIVVPDY